MSITTRQRQSPKSDNLRFIPPARAARRGTLLVVILGLLVALFLIGTSFTFVTLTERHAATNYLDRQRALDLAMDGVQYSIARLRAENIDNHFEGLSVDVAGFGLSDYDAESFSLRPLDGQNPAVSWSRAVSSSAGGRTPDAHWVDFNGDGNRETDETGFRTDRPATFPGRVTGFHADGISTRMVPTENVPRIDGRAWGLSGTYEELGDYFRVRAIDAAAMLPLNNYRTIEDYERVLLILGQAVDFWISGATSGRNNPFPPDIAREMSLLAERQDFLLYDKEVFRPLFASHPDGQRLYELGMNFVTLSSWRDDTYRDYAANNTAVDDDNNPMQLTRQERMRSGFTYAAGAGQDGWPDWQPDPARQGASPININTAPWPVLVALFAGIEAKGRLLYYQRQDAISQFDLYIKEVSGHEVPQQISGTTDLGRQNSRDNVDGTGIRDENLWAPGNAQSRAIFQMVPIGPIETRFGESGQSGTGGAHAEALADLVVRLRSQRPFQSWLDFDARFFREELLRLSNDRREGLRVPDLVGVERQNLNRNVDVARQYPASLLPDPANCNHPANPLRSGDAGMSGNDFRAWYWKSVVDMLRAALCLDNIVVRNNVDYPYHMNVDRMDLTWASSPISFSSMGVYEVASVGEIMAPERGAMTSTADTRPVARRMVRSVVEIYEVWRHSRQVDFMDSLDPADATRTPSGPGDPPRTMAAHTKFWTKSGPYSFDELSNGSWDENPNDLQTRLNRAEDARRIAYTPTDVGIDDTRDRWKGHNDGGGLSRDTGYITMDPMDRTPFDETSGRMFPLNFHARFNESLRGRYNTSPRTDPTTWQQGILSDDIVRHQLWGHLPLESRVVFDDFVSSATPRSTAFQFGPNGEGMASNEFQAAALGDEATKYATLRPDGVYLGGGSLRMGWKDRLVATFGQRGLERPPRLKILRYPNGSHYSNRPFMPIQPADGSFLKGVRDGDLPNDAHGPTYAGQNIIAAHLRLVGTAPPYRGLDQHNIRAEVHRQTRANMPYYQGTVDFWIKWDLPPQGSERNNFVTAMGEVDPTSNNLSGLFGATAYGRFQDATSENIHFDHTKWNNPSSSERNMNADFEGVQFYVFKEPGGFLRFVRLYFAEAFGGRVTHGTAGSEISNIERFGWGFRRIGGQEPWDGFMATNDICNSPTNLGFLFTRTEAWLDLSDASFMVGGGGDLILRPHDWHRFTLSYNSNTVTPYHLWLNGRKVHGVTHHDADLEGESRLRNDGSHRGPGGIRDSYFPMDAVGDYVFLRSTVRLLEINPEDRLTVGCIFRRQVDPTNPASYADYYDHPLDVGNTTRPPRPLFRFDANLVAVANATIDDFRVSSQPIPDTLLAADLSATQGASRYMPKNDPWVDRTYFEHGFLPVADAEGMIHGMPLRLGTISWTELRPDWDPWRGRGLNLFDSSRLRMEWGVFPNYDNVPVGGVEHDLSRLQYSGMSDDMVGTDPSLPNYWARGGISLNRARMPSGRQIGLLMYRVYFVSGDSIVVNNVTPFLLDVTVTVLTPPRVNQFSIVY